MGGLWKSIPFTWAMMLIGNLALTGVGIPYLGVGLAGFYSKDAIINATYGGQGGMATYAFILLVLAAGMTSFYSWRQFLMTFHGRYRGLDHQPEHGAAHDDHGHHLPKLEEVHESPVVMLVPLAVLALGAAFAGAVFFHYFVGEGAGTFWHASIFLPKPGEAELPVWVELAPMTLTIIGFLIAYYYYILNPELPRILAARRGMLYLFLYNKWYFDELYDLIFVRPAFWIGRFLWKQGDGTIIDGLGPDGVSARVLDAARGAVRLQSGYVYHYALAMLLGRGGAGDLVRRAGEVGYEFADPQPRHLRAADRRGADPGDAAPGPGALGGADHHHRHLRPVAGGLGGVRSPQSRLPAGRKSELAGRRHLLSHGGGRHFHAVRGPDRGTDALLHRRQLGSDPGPGAGIYDRLPGARDHDDRGVLRAGSGACSMCCSKAA